MLGWVITICYIILFFDIITISLNDLYESANKTTKKIATELFAYLNKLDKNVKDIEDDVEKVFSDNNDTNKISLILKAIDKIE